MKLKRILSLIVAVALVWSCAPHMPLLAKAETVATEPEGTPTVLYCVTDLGVEGSVIVDSLDEAFSKIEAKNKQWKAGDSVEIRITGTEHTGGHQDGLLFGQTTIWREDGTKLPITIRGVDDNKGAYIYLDSAGGWYACANDYTFINLTLPIGDQETLFYAGSGNITFIEVSFNKLDPGTTSVEEQTAKYEVYKYVAQKVTNDEENLIIPDVSNLPIGDAWQLARERDNFIGEGLMGMYGTYYGDGKHDGDTGGGQYLNACIYYEVMTGLSCVGNTWRPDYELSEEMITFLQNVAHDTVVATYGEDHYKDSWTDFVGNDNEFNILILGSSNCAYLTDELHALCTAAGIKNRVYHAYYSGVPITTQWNWIQNDNGNYLLYKFENGIKSSVDNQKITDFLMDYQWDTITIYQSTNVISKYANDEEGLALAYATCQYADDFYNYMYNYENGAHQGAKYYWYQVAASAVGAISMKSDALGKIFADNCTQAAYEGWDELEPGEKVESSITFGYEAVYRNTTDPVVAAVGYQETAPDTPYTDETAHDLKYMEASGYDNVADIRPADVKASIIVDGEYAYVYKILGKMGYAPSDASVILKQGTTPYIYGAQAPTGSTAPYYGDIALEYYSGTLESWRGIYGNVTGDVTIILDGATITNYMITVQAGYTVDGDMLFDIRDGRIEGRIYTAGNGNTADPAVYSTVTGTVTFRWGGGYIKEISHGRRSNIGNFVNEFYVNPDAEIPASTDSTFALAGTSSCTIAGEVRNTFTGAVPASVTGKISNFGGSSGTISKIVNTVKADENGNAPSFTAYNGGAATEIVNNIEAGTFGSFVPGTGNTVTTTVTGGTFDIDPSAYVAEGYTAVKNANGTYTVENHNYVPVSESPATCVSGGEIRYECSDCDAVKVVTLELDPDAHDWDTTDPDNYTCKNGCGKTTAQNHPFDYQSSIYCEGCKKNIDKELWTPISLSTLNCTSEGAEASSFELANGNHYYLAEDIYALTSSDIGLLQIATENVEACLHLNGKNLINVAEATLDNMKASLDTLNNVSVKNDDGTTGTCTGTAIVISAASTLNIMGDGYVSSRNDYVKWGTVNVYGGTLNIYGGTYCSHRSSKLAVMSRGGNADINIYGGTFLDPVGFAYGKTGSLSICGGTFKGYAAFGATGATASNCDGSITVESGTFEANAIATDALLNAEKANVKPVISGGTFSVDPAAYLASGYAAEESGGTWTVVKAPETPVLNKFDPEGCDGWAYCEACYKQAIAAGKTEQEALEASLKEWTVFTGGTAVKNTHYYLNRSFENYGDSENTRFLTFNSTGTICWNLNGHSVSMASTGVSMVRAYTNGTINIMDTEGTGVLTGYDYTTNTGTNGGSVVEVRGSGILNVYGGTLRRAEGVGGHAAVGSHGSSYTGTINIYGGTIDGLFVRAGGTANLAGAPTITDLSIGDNAVIDIDGLLPGAAISVKGTAGKVLTDPSDNAATVKGCFTAETDGLVVDVNDQKQLVIVEAPKPAWDENAFTTGFQPETYNGYAYCEACYKQALAAGKTEQEAKDASLKVWTVYTGAYYDNAAGVVKAADSAHEHLYLTGNRDFSSVEFFLATKGDVCINLNGWNVTSTATKDDAEAGTQLPDSAFYTEGNLNIMDAKGTSEIKAAICTAIARGNAVHAANGGVCNLYGGTYTQGSAIARLISAGADGTVNIYEGVTVSAADITEGTRDNCIYLDGAEGKPAVVNVYGGSITGGTITSNSNRYGASINIDEYGECNIYGGTVSGGKNRSNSDSTGYFGGNIYVGATGALNVYGGKIYDGEASAAGGNIYAVGEVNIVDDPNIPGEPEIYGGVAGTHGGNISAEEGATVTMSGGKVYGGSAADSCANVFVSDTSTFTQSGDAEIYSYSVETATGRTWYATMADALANYQASDAAYVGLWDTVEFALTEDAYVALMTGADPTVSGAYKLYAMDTTQDDYTGTAYNWTVADETEIVRDVKNPVNGNRYINVTASTDAGVETMNSFRMERCLSTVSLRPGTTSAGMGLYYKAKISTSAALAEKINAYGVVLSLTDMPDATFATEKNDAGNNQNGWTTLQEKLAVTEDNNYSVTINSGAVFGIMKDDGSLANEANTLRGQLPIYANVYLQIDADNDGEFEYYMSDDSTTEQDDIAWSLERVMKAVETNFETYDDRVQGNIAKFYKHWAPYGMNAWETELAKIAAKAATIA